MKLSRLFRRFKKERPAPEPEPRKPAPPPAAKPAPPSPKKPVRAAAPAPAKPVPAPVAAPPKPAESPRSVEEIADIFGTIQAVLDGDDREEEKLRASQVVEVPCAAVLGSLPANLRGPQWVQGQYPEATLKLDLEDVLEQLRTGQVVYSMRKFSGMLPQGWIGGEADVEVSLDLPMVVAAIPPDRLVGAQGRSQSMEEVGRMRALFSPKRSLQDARAETQPELAFDGPEVAAPAASVTPPAPAKKAMEPSVGAVPVEAAKSVAPATVPTPAPAVKAPAAQVPVAKVPPAPAPAPSAVAAVTAPEIAAVPVKAKVAPPPPVVAPAPAFAPPAPVDELAAEAETEDEFVEFDLRYGPVGWDGIESSFASATGGVDINTASAEELERLPGIGGARAREIMAERERAPFANIYELARVPGIGPKLFRQMTGLSLTSGRNRHEELNRLLDFDEKADRSLYHIVTAMKEKTGALGCVLSGLDGVPLAQTQGMGDLADKYAAVSAQLFRRTARYLYNLTGEDVECIALPLAEPPVLLFGKGDYYFVITQDEKRQGIRDLKRANAIVHELEWLLGQRAVVRAG